jgi:putative membrane protein
MNMPAWILIGDFTVGLVALLHLSFLVLEMFFWNKPLGRRIFRLTPEFAHASAALAANQGLYNGFLAGGLLWSLVLGPAGLGFKLFFLGCVIVAGIFGALTVNRRILWVQALPGAMALVLVLLVPA